MSSLGQALGTLYQPERETPYYTRWEFGVQRDLGGGWVAAFTYLGSRGSQPAGGATVQQHPDRVPLDVTVP